MLCIQFLLMCFNAGVSHSASHLGILWRIWLQINDKMLQIAIISVMMCYDIHSRWNLVRRFFWHARSSIPVQTFFNTIMLQIREVDSDSSWSNVIEPPKNPTKNTQKKYVFQVWALKILYQTKKTTFQVPRVPPSFAVSLHTSAEPTRHRARRRAWRMWPMLNEYTLAKFPIFMFKRSK